MQEGWLCFYFLFKGWGGEGYLGPILGPIKWEIPIRHLKGNAGWQVWGSGGQSISSTNYILPLESK